MTTLENKLMRQQDLDFQHAVCDAYYPLYEHVRPLQRVVDGPVLIASQEEEEVIEDFDPYPLPATTMKEQARITAHKHGVTVQELIGHSRKHYLREPRKDFIKTCMDPEGLHKTLAQIARFMSDRDHTSIYHYAKLAQADAEQVAA